MTASPFARNVQSCSSSNRGPGLLDRSAQDLVWLVPFPGHRKTRHRRRLASSGFQGGDQTWHTFIRNHGKAVWSCDFLTQHTAFFTVAYIFVIMEIGSRRIIHVNVTSNPTLPWGKQGIREATSDDVAPRFLVHDSDGIFGQCGKAVTFEENGRRRSYRCHLDRWLDEVIGIEGLPIPYGAPNASPHVERFVRPLREEALNRFLFLGVDHIHRIVVEYIRYYHLERNHQGLGNELIERPTEEAHGGVECRERLGGVLKYYYRRAA